MVVNGNGVSEINIREIQFEQTIELLEERIAELEFQKEDIGWTRLTGETDIELARDHLMRVVARSRLFYLINPLVNRAVCLQADYVFAQGLNVQATDKKVNAVVQDFLDDPGNINEFIGHQARLMKEQTLMLDGNVFLVLFTNKSGNGKVKLRSILIDEIVDIITDPDDQNVVWFYKRQWHSRINGQIGSETKTQYYPDINYNPITKTPTYKGDTVSWDAPVYHIKVGALAKSRFGIPEVYSALDWAQAHRKMLEDWATIVRAYARFAFRMTTPGNAKSVTATKTRLGTTVTQNAPIETNAPPIPGSIFTTTKDGPTLDPIKTSGATTSAHDARELRLMVASALGMPDTFISGDVDVGSMATAKTLDRPTELKFRSRQQTWTDVIKTIINYVIKWAFVAPQGPLSKRASFSVDDEGNLVIKGSRVDPHIEVIFPPILEHSILDRINAVTEAVTLNGKTFAVDSPELQKLTIRMMLQALGLNDVDELVDHIFKNVPENTPPNPKPQPQPQPNVIPQPVKATGV
jgi:hypothetical protein